MNTILQNLLKLQVLEFGEAATENTKAQGAELRGKIPAPILAHYDRLRIRGKKGIAIVRNQVCTGCHMRVPIGLITTVMRGEDVQICENCGRYICLPNPAEAAAEAAARVEAAKPMTKEAKAAAKVEAKAAKVAAKTAKAAAKPRKRQPLMTVD